MFDSVLAPTPRATRLVGRGAAVSIAMHAGALALTIYLSARAAAHRAGLEPPTVTFVAAAPPPPPPPPPAGGASTPKPRTVTPKPHPIVVPKEVPREPEPDPEPEEEEEDPGPATSAPGSAGGVPGGVVGGVAGGVVGGVVGGTPGGVVGGAPGGTGVLPFGEGMTRPSLLGGSDPVYTREALVARVQGLMIVKCVITTQGAIDSCRVIKGLPFMNDAVVAALRTRRYTPVQYQGRPVAVDYVFNVKLVLP